MKISCNECRQQLGELIDAEATGEVAGSVPAGSIHARNHVAECAQCTSELALLRRAQNELKAFPVVAVPSDLRQRVRAQVAYSQSSTAQGSTVQSTPVPAIVPILQPAPKNLAAGEFSSRYKTKTFRSNRDLLIHFLQRPTNIAWSSGLTVALFALVLVVRSQDPEMSSLPSKTTRVSSSGDYGKPVKDETTEKEAESARSKTGAAKPAAKPQPGALPRLQPGALPPTATGEPPSALVPLPAMEGDEPALLPGSPFGEIPADAPPAASTTSKKFAAPAVAEPKAARPAAPPASSQRARANTPAPSISQAPNLPEPTRASENSPAPALSAAQERPRPRITTTPDSSRRQAREKQDAFAQRDESSGARSMMAPGASGAAGAPATQKPAATSARNSRVAADADNVAPVSRQVVARIAAPRDISWGQVSVVLPAGVRFEGGGKARVVWRGAASAGQNIVVRFKVQAGAGSHAIRVSLQEVHKGEAETLARDSVSVSGR